MINSLIVNYFKSFWTVGARLLIGYSTFGVDLHIYLDEKNVKHTWYFTKLSLEVVDTIA